MINKEDGTFVLSPSDLTSSAKCEFGWMRANDIKLGRLPAMTFDEDAMLARTAALGDLHEEKELARLKSAGLRVVEIERPTPYSAATLRLAEEQTVAALESGADVVFQATFFDGTFGGMSDFIRRTDDGSYAVWDAKLARRARTTALLQIAAYADQLDRLGIPRSPFGYLLLGDNSEHKQPLDEIIYVYHERRALLESMLTAHIAQPDPTAWNDDRYSFCGSCDHCAPEVEAGRDLLIVAGMRKDQRAKLRAAGVPTIESLAARVDAVPKLSASTLDVLRDQARLQVAPPTVVDGRELPAFEVINDGAAIRRLPAPSVGDVFFDFEGDPLWSEDSEADQGVKRRFGLEYLFGVVEAAVGGAGEFRPWWAHSRAEEGIALKGFLDYLRERRKIYPDLHVYHYASYEVSALKRLVGDHQYGEDFLDELLRANVFVDLYTVVRQSVRVGTASYSIKKLEPLYMGDDEREGLDNAADSMVFYQSYVDAVSLGDTAEAQRWIDEIARYNRYDCLSTWRLRDWLRAQVDDSHSSGPRGDESSESTDPIEVEESIDELAPIVDSLLKHAGSEDAARTPDEQAAAMVAAALGFHRREHKPFWWAFFSRLEDPPTEWLEPRDCLHADSVTVLEGWVTEGRKLPRRRIRLTGMLEPGSNLKVGKTVKGIYEDIPHGIEPPEGLLRAVGGGAAIEEVGVDDDGCDVLIINESTGKGVSPWTALPIGVCIPRPVTTTSIESTLLELGRELGDQLPDWPRSAALDLFRRVPPRLTTMELPEISVDPIDAIYDAVTQLDRSYLAVQGPPGTGKTYVGSRVVTHLVEQGWRVGVVAQSHSTVENFFTAAIEAGISPSVVAKPAQDGDTSEKPWSELSGAKLQDFIASRDGCLVGGTAWTFSNRKTVGAEQLDLLVIDEAGQFSLANTLAVSTAAKRLLLLGDPQQLPQVTQGTHPEPVDISALEWIADGHETMPPDRGYFLAHTWRMHSALTERVSVLAYEGRLRSNVDVTDARAMTGVEPGLHTVLVEHHHNKVQSREEAASVIGIVRRVQSETWQDSTDSSPRAVRPSDVLVVAPYNAQVALLRKTLDAAGFPDTQVGTVDKFQGREAPIVIVSMTASSAEDVPRGVEFLLNRNRLNVAISRAQWASFTVRSPKLTEYLPASPAGLAELGAFLQLSARASQQDSIASDPIRGVGGPSL